MVQYEYSQMHYLNLLKMFFEGRSTYNLRDIQYALNYLSQVNTMEFNKMESLTRYLIDNFDNMKETIKEELNASKLKKDRIEGEVDISGEWANRSNSVKLGFWINTQKGSLSLWTKFKNINLTLSSLPKSMYDKTILRVFWFKQDIREFQRREFCPYICISGIYFIDQIKYPFEAKEIKNWKVKNLVEDRYKITTEEMKESNSGTIRIKYTIDINNNVYIKDLEKEQIEIRKFKYPKVDEVDKDTIEFRLQNATWEADNVEFNEFNKEKKQINFYTNELANFGILLDRKMFFPYKSWYLRCINDHTAVL
jgi:hypothetical protein